MRSSKFTLTVVVLSCIFLYSCRKKGCTHELAVNYNEKAKVDDGSCEYDDQGYYDDLDCSGYFIKYVDSVTAPSTGDVNDTINIEVDLVFNYSGCNRFERFIESQNGNSRTIEVEVYEEGCVCATAIEIMTVDYKFVVSNTGTYELNFKSDSTEYITVNLEIE